MPDGPDTANPFGKLAFGAILVAMILTMAVTMARRTRQIAVDGPAAAAEQRFRRVNVLGLVVTGYAVTIVMSAMTVESIPAFGDTLSVMAWFVLLPLTLFGFGVNYWMFRAAIAQSRLLRGGRFTETPPPTTRGKSVASIMSTRTTRPCGSRTVSALATH